MTALSYLLTDTKENAMKVRYCGEVTTLEAVLIWVGLRGSEERFVPDLMKRGGVYIQGVYVTRVV